MPQSDDTGSSRIWFGEYFVMSYSKVQLRKNEDRRIRDGHLWVYSNEVDVKATPLRQFQAGQLVEVINHQGKFLGLGYINPQTLLSIRLLSTQPNVIIDKSFFMDRINKAKELRDRLYSKPYYRLIYGESDGLPGVIADRYDDHLCVQITTAGMESLKQPLLDALQQVLQPKSILWRNDHGMRATEGLNSYVEAGLGQMPEEIKLIENEVTFYIDPWRGQKTGWFYDHRENRAQLKRFVQNKKVLDLFSYVGGWSIPAAVWGAAEVWSVDSSAKALEYLMKNAKANQVADKINMVNQDAFEQLKIFQAEQRQFDVIVIDPPAFIKKRKDITQGLIAYRRVNEMSLRLLSPGGILISASCSHHLSREQLVDLVLQSSVKLNRDIKIIGQGYQGPDHPIHPAIPETEYLKAVFFYCN